MFRARRLLRRGRARPAVVDEAAPAAEQADDASAPDTAGTLKELAELREQGILTEEEFAAEKKKLLGM